MGVQDAWSSTGAIGDVGDIQGALCVEKSMGSSSLGGVLSLPLNHSCEEQDVSGAESGDEATRVTAW